MAQLVLESLRLPHAPIGRSPYLFVAAESGDRRIDHSISPVLPSAGGFSDEPVEPVSLDASIPIEAGLPLRLFGALIDSDRDIESASVLLDNARHLMYAVGGDAAKVYEEGLAALQRNGERVLAEFVIRHPAEDVDPALLTGESEASETNPETRETTTVSYGFDWIEAPAKPEGE